MNREIRCAVIVLAAGQGKRMGTEVSKQYLEVQGYPVLYHSLRVCQDSTIIQEIILVTGQEEIEMCRNVYKEQYGLNKIQAVIAGGRERYDSVYAGLQYISENIDYIYIHDGARPMLTEEIMVRGLEAVQAHEAVVAGVLAKDTVRIVDEDRRTKETPDRNSVWNIQTPQIFEAKLIKNSYETMMKQDHSHVTDDAMVVESFGGKRVRIFEGSYENIKITTPEDLQVAELFLGRKQTML